MGSWEPSYALQNGNGRLLCYSDHQIQLTAMPKRAKLKLQCLAAEKRKVASGSFSIELPDGPNNVTDIYNPIFWMAPNEWLMVFDDKPSLTPGISAEEGIAITDVSDSLVEIEVSGLKSPALLGEGCCIDIQEERFSLGHYVATRFFHLTVLIQKVSEMPAFNLYVDRSEARHLWHALESHTAVL